MITFKSTIYGEVQEVEDIVTGKQRRTFKECVQRRIYAMNECCSVPKPDPMKEDSSCRVYLEGLDGKTERENLIAERCFTECMFETRGFFKDGAFNKPKILEAYESLLTEHNELDLLNISRTSIDSCINACKSLLKISA